MVNTTKELVAIHLPADLASRIETLKKGRTEDQNKTLEDLVLAMCRRYVRIREMALEEVSNMEAIEESYRLHPYDYEDNWPQDDEKPQEKQ